MKENIRAIVKEPGKDPKWVWHPNTLKGLQETVGGYIEVVEIFSDVVIICNEEGLINALPYNCTLFGHQLFGTILIAGVDGAEFDDAPLAAMKTIFGGGAEE